MREEHGRPVAATPDAPEKPSRSYTKTQTGVNVALCWLALFGGMWLGRDMAAIVVPIMATLIAALLGVYQTIGHFDLRALATLSGARHPKPARPRQRQPPADTGDARTE